MLRLLTTDEFAVWYAALDQERAEEVATGLEIVERLGPAQAAPSSSEWLLWYQDPEAARSRWLDDFALYRASVLKYGELLGSERFRSRLKRLKPVDAARVEVALEQIRVSTSQSRALLALQDGWQPDWQPSDPVVELRRWYLEALSAAGFHFAEFAEYSRALRELSMRSRPPGFRVLFGVDVPRETALLLLGEPLDRRYYGDSVRRAQRVWDRFLQAELDGFEPAHLR